MSLRYSILGMLSKWDATGYDLKKEFDDVMSVFWHSHLSQIYTELNKIEIKEWVKSDVIAQVGKPDKKVYSITEKGKEELIKWLVKSPEKPQIKDPFLMQTFFKDNIPIDEVIHHLKIYKRHREERLDTIKCLMQDRWIDIKKRNVMKPRIVLSFAVLKRGLESEVNYIRWCDETVHLLEACSHLWEDEEKTYVDCMKDGGLIKHTTKESFESFEDLFESYLFTGLSEYKS